MTPRRRACRQRHRRGAVVTQILVSWTASTDASGIGGYRVFRNGGATPIATRDRPLATPTPASPPRPHYSYTVSAVDARESPANVSAASAAANATTDAPRRRTSAASMRGPRMPPASRAIRRARTFRSPCSRCSRTCRISRSPSRCCRSPATPRAGTWCRRPGRCACSTTRPNVSTTREFIDISLAAQFRTRAAPTTSAACSAWRSIRTTRPTRACISSTPARTARSASSTASSSSAALDGGQTRRSGSELELFNVDDPEEQPQRRQHRLRSGRVPLHRHR